MDPKSNNQSHRIRNPKTCIIYKVSYNREPDRKSNDQSNRIRNPKIYTTYMIKNFRTQKHNIETKIDGVNRKSNNQSNRIRESLRGSERESNWGFFVGRKCLKRTLARV